MGDLVPRIYLTNIKLLPLALCGDVYEGDETDHEPEKESQSPQNLLSVTIAFIYTLAIASYIIVWKWSWVYSYLITSKSNHYWHKMLSDVISEHVFFKNFLGGHAPRPPYLKHASHAGCASHTSIAIKYHWLKLEPPQLFPASSATACTEYGALFTYLI